MERNDKSHGVDYIKALEGHFVQLAKAAMQERTQEVRRILRRVGRETYSSSPDFSTEVAEISALQSRPSGSVFREASPAMKPVDRDTRQDLVRTEYPVVLEYEPVWSENLRQTLLQILGEHLASASLSQHGLEPARSVIFTGPPGVGKTYAARWLARELELPLLVLDLSVVISSYLGRTGNNLKSVFDYAKKNPCVLLLDELDTIAKKRDDDQEIGELKRLVTVLLQEMDQWPTTGLLISATNHDSLLDPAIWRRFDYSIQFPFPLEEEIKQAVLLYADRDVDRFKAIIPLLQATLKDHSYSDIQRIVMSARRASHVRGENIRDVIMDMTKSDIRSMSRQDRLTIAKRMTILKVSQRQIYRVTGISRDTLRSKMR